MHIKNYNPAWLVACFLFLYMLLGLFVYKDYGISWDEVTSRTNGQININHIVNNYIPSLSAGVSEHAKLLPDLHDWKDKDYGVAFEAPVFALEYLIGIKDNRDRYLFRHLMTFLFSLLGVLAIYGIVKKRYGNYSTALLATLLYILSPRIFAESFYNSKDIVFMASFAMAIYTMLCFLSKPGAFIAIAHGFVTALAIDIRIMGIIIFCATLGVFTVQLVKKDILVQQYLTATTIYILTACAFVIAMFPFLWADPLGNFIFALDNMTKFRWDSDILYMGEFIRSTNLPWHYAPVWILITTPPIYIFLLATGISVTIHQLVKRKLGLWENRDEMQDLIFLSLLAGPVLAVIVLNSVLYDGWRQLYFIYPPLILVATRGFVYLHSRIRHHKNIKNLAMTVLCLSLLYNVFWMWSAHPLQNVYFNFLVGNDWKNKFEMDYWGLGNKDALEYILKYDDDPFITIRPESNTPLQTSLHILRPKERARIVILNSDSESMPKYILTNYRQVWNRDDEKYTSKYNLFYQKKVSGEVILSVFKRKTITPVPNTE